MLLMLFTSVNSYANIFVVKISVHQRTICETFIHKTLFRAKSNMGNIHINDATYSINCLIAFLLNFFFAH